MLISCDLAGKYDSPPTTTSLYSVMASLDGWSAAPAQLDLEISRPNHRSELKCMRVGNPKGSNSHQTIYRFSRPGLFLAQSERPLSIYGDFQSRLFSWAVSAHCARGVAPAHALVTWTNSWNRPRSPFLSTRSRFSLDSLTVSGTFHPSIYLLKACTNHVPCVEAKNSYEEGLTRRILHYFAHAFPLIEFADVLVDYVGHRSDYALSRYCPPGAAKTTGCYRENPRLRS